MFVRLTTAFARCPRRRMRIAFCLALVEPFSAMIAGSGRAQTMAQTKIACLGEATTHSTHRNYDPEYPELMGMYLDTNYKNDASPANPLGGGMLYGGGTNYRIGNFGIPTGVAFETAGPDVTPTISSPQLTMAEGFAPDVVILGPYGPEEPQDHSGVPITGFLPGLRALAMRVLAFPSKPALFISIPLPRGGVAGDATRGQIQMDTVQVATELALPTIDLWTAFLGKTTEFADQNHLTVEGRTHMAQVVGDAIKAWKAGSSSGTPGNVDGGGPSNSDASVERGGAGPAGPAAGTGGVQGTGGLPGGIGGTVGSGGGAGAGGPAASSGGSTGSGGALMGSGGSTASGVAFPGSGGTSSNFGAAGGAKSVPGIEITNTRSAGCACTQAATPTRQGTSSAAVLVVVGLIAVARRTKRRRNAR